MDLKDRIPKFKAYPPVPNWYCSNVTAVVDPHLFLYATKNVVVALELKDLTYFNSFAVTADKEKVIAIAAHDSICFAAGTDKVVRGWNILLGSFITKHTEHSTEITSLKLIRQGTVLISGDKSGRVVVMDPYGELKHVSNKVKSEIICMSTMVHNGNDYVAIGYSNGMIFVEHIGTDLSLTTEFQIADDNDTIQSLDWQIIHTRKIEEESTRWPLLASSTKRKKSVFVWRFPSQNLLCNFKLPIPPAQATDQQKSTVSIQLAWSPVHENKLYLSSYIGSILCYDISGKPKLNQKERLDRHSRNVFTINWFNEGKNCITTSMDKQVIKWDMNKKSCVQNLKTQAMYPYSLDVNSSNIGQIAIGMGDNAIKFWNFSNEGAVMKTKKYHDYYDATVVWKGLQGKIEKIKWHPNKEGLLAYSNEYGRVGIYDTFNLKNIPFKSFHKYQSAPSIDWGLDTSNALEDSDMTDTLLSCGGDGIIHVYDINTPNGPPINLNERLKENNPVWFTTLEAKSSNRCVLKIDRSGKYIAFGHTDGTVEVYTLSTLKLIFVSNCERQLIRALDWKVANEKILLASGSDSGDIAIHDISKVLLSDIPDVPVPQSEALHLLKGHKKGVSDLRWSSHDDKYLLVSGADDNLVVVWDITLGKNISVFNKHRGSVLCVCWNPMNPDVIFSGSEDRFLYEWNHNDFICTDSVSSQKSLRVIEYGTWNAGAKKRKADDIDSSGSVASTPDKITTFSLKKKPKKSDVEKAARDISTNSSFMPVAREADRVTSQLKKKQFCMILADKIFDGKVCKSIHQIIESHLTVEEKLDNTVARYINVFQNQQQDKKAQHNNIHELFFGDKNDIRQLIEIEADALNKSEANASSTPVYSAQDDIKGSTDLKLAMDIMQCQYSMFNEGQFDLNTNSCMSEWVVLALSPMVGKETWIALMLKQAKKLESLNQYHLSASCYVACAHIYDAIAVYRKQSMYREAIALAKLRLPGKDPIIEELFAEWANVLQKDDFDSLTASCYLMSKTTGSVNNAINALARSGKEDGLFYAACLASVIKDGTEIQRIEQWLKKMKERLLKKTEDVSSINEDMNKTVEKLKHDLYLKL